MLPPGSTHPARTSRAAARGSVAPTPAAPRADGDLGCVARGVTVPEFEDALFATPTARSSDPVETEFGFHIIKVVQHDGPTFEAAKPLVLQKVLADSNDGLQHRVEREARRGGREHRCSLRPLESVAEPRRRRRPARDQHRVRQQRLAGSRAGRAGRRRRPRSGRPRAGHRAARCGDRANPDRFLRTARHPSASVVRRRGESFDDVYESGRRSTTSTARSSSELVAAAVEHGEVLYAVPGSPLVPSGRVELLPRRRPGRRSRSCRRCRSSTWPGRGSASTRRGGRAPRRRPPLRASRPPGERGPLLVAQCDTPTCCPTSSSPSRCRRRAEPVAVLQRLGLPDERVVEVAWAELDRVVEPDHLTSLCDPAAGRPPVAGELVRFAELVRTLRGRVPVGPRADPRSRSPATSLEETYEVARGDRGARPRRPATDCDTSRRSSATCSSRSCSTPRSRAEAGRFTLADVARGIHDKLVRRHPHVFGDVDADDADTVLANWEEIKKAEKGRDSRDRRHPRRLPALLYAAKVQRKAASVGFDWDDVEGALPKVDGGARRARCEALGPTASTDRGSRPSSATCCSPWSTWPAHSASTPRRRCARRRQVPRPLPAVEALAASRGSTCRSRISTPSTRCGTTAQRLPVGTVLDWQHEQHQQHRIKQDQAADQRGVRG